MMIMMSRIYIEIINKIHCRLKKEENYFMVENMMIIEIYS